MLRHMGHTVEVAFDGKGSNPGPDGKAGVISRFLITDHKMPLVYKAWNLSSISVKMIMLAKS